MAVTTVKVKLSSIVDPAFETLATSCATDLAKLMYFVRANAHMFTFYVRDRVADAINSDKIGELPVEIIRITETGDMQSLIDRCYKLFGEVKKDEVWSKSKRKDVGFSDKMDQFLWRMAFEFNAAVAEEQRQRQDLAAEDVDVCQPPEDFNQRHEWKGAKDGQLGLRRAELPATLSGKQVRVGVEEDRRGYLGNMEALPADDFKLMVDVVQQRVLTGLVEKMTPLLAENGATLSITQRGMENRARGTVHRHRQRVAG